MFVQRQRRRENLLIVAVATLVGSLVAGFIGFEVWRSYDATLASARQRAENLVHVLDEQTRGAVRAVDLSLLGIVHALRLEPETPSHDPMFTQMLRSRVAELPYVRALFVVAPDGFIIQDSDLDTPRRNLADRDYFQVHVNNPESGLFIGPPLRSRSTGAPWFLSVSRRITLADGTFYGVAVAAIEPQFFARFYSRIAMGDDSTLSLVHRDGLMVARFPGHDRAVGAPFANTILFREQLPERPIGTYVAKSMFDGVERILSYRSLDPLPLIVVVGMGLEVAMQNWRSTVVTAGAATLGWTLILALATAALIRQRARDARTIERLHQIEKSEALGRITSGVAHDFNNLLTIISGNLEIIDQGLPEGHRLRHNVERATQAIERGARLVRQLLAFARRQPESATRENPRELLLGAEELLGQAAAPVGLRLECAPQTWDCEIDRSDFERAMMNLVVNARDARPKSPIRVVTRNIPMSDFDRRAWPELNPGDYVACCVFDDGAGMPPDVVRRAYEPFFSTKGVGKGTGLGLSQVYSFARQSGGSARIESKPGGGTAVTILLPRMTRPPVSPTEKRGTAPAEDSVEAH